jgi:hypothetical protein
MTRAEILSHALFDTGGEIDGLKFGPLSQPCLVILKRRRNGLLAESNRDQDDHEAIGEILFVLSRSKEQRQAMFRDSAEEWDLKVGEFMAGLGDDTLPKFRDEYLGPAMTALALSIVESESPGKPVPTHQTSRSSSQELRGSDLFNSQGQQVGKIHYGTSPQAPCCNCSMPTPSATAPASAGRTGRKQTPKKSRSLSASRSGKS